MKNFLLKLKDSLIAVLPISVTVIVLALTPLAKMDSITITGFVIGSVLLIFGMSLFTLGIDVAMQPMGELMGSGLMKTKKLWIILPVCFFIGFLVAFAEPGLTVLGNQLEAINTWMLLAVIGVGVGFFLLIAMLKTIFQLSLNKLIIIGYGLLFIVAIIMDVTGKGAFLPFAFDSGGAVTGAITVPFIIAFGIGIAAIKANSKTDDSFGYISLCVIGAILPVMILGMITPSSKLDIAVDMPELNLVNFLTEIPLSLKNVAIPIVMIIAFFLVFQFTLLKMPKKKLFRMLIGMVYSFIGLAIFMTGLNSAFIPVGNLLGVLLAQHSFAWILIPIGMFVGFLIVAAEPSVYFLTTQVEQLSSGMIKKRSMLLTLMLGIGLAIGLAMIRVLTGISIWWFLAPGYIIAIVLSFITPKTFSAIAFDSGGVASGLMTASFLVPFAIGASGGLGGNILTDAFGLIAFVSMVPLVVVQIMGILAVNKSKRQTKNIIRIEPDDYTVVELY